MDRDRKDHSVRMAVFEWLSDQVTIHGDVLPRKVLSEGLTLDGVRVPLVGPQGIFKPKAIPEVPLSITTAPLGPYDDKLDSQGLLQYRYRGTDPQHHENVGLRKAMATQTPLVYFHGLVKGRYLATWPVYVVGDNAKSLTFLVAVDDAKHLGIERHQVDVSEPATLARRAYVTSLVKRRVHQRSFRERVLRAYREQCALCRLRHTELLDAAHIIPDSDPRGSPEVSNGLALCKLHHAAFDRHFIAIRPDYHVEVRNDILQEEDGPMLLHGLKGMHQRVIAVPRDRSSRPNPELLAERFKNFLQT